MSLSTVKGANVSGFNKFIILSAHGQVSSTIVAVHKLGLEGIFTLSLHWYDFLRDDKDVLEDWMWHADEAETSVALYLFPEFVDMRKAAKGGGEPLVDRKFIIAPGARPRPGTMYHHVAELIEDIRKRYEPGVNHSADFFDIGEEDWDWVISVDLKGTFFVSQGAAKVMVDQGKGGSIVNVSSVMAQLALADQIPYCAAKGGVNQLLFCRSSLV